MTTGPLIIPIELAIKIAQAVDNEDDDEYVFNLLARAVPAIGRWTITDNIIDKRLTLMEIFGYNVEFDTLRSLVTGYDISCITWHKRGEYHRNDGPARIYEDGDYVWYIHDCAIEGPY